MAVTGRGDAPLRSRWLRRGGEQLHRPIRKTTGSTSASKNVWTDWFFAAAGPATQTITGTGIASTATVPTGGSVNAGVVALGGTGISSTATFGAGVVGPGVVAITGTGIASTVQIGTGELGGVTEITGTGIASTMTLGGGGVIVSVGGGGVAGARLLRGAGP